MCLFVSGHIAIYSLPNCQRQGNDVSGVEHIHCYVKQLLFTLDELWLYEIFLPQVGAQKHKS